MTPIVLLPLETALTFLALLRAVDAAVTHLRRMRSPCDLHWVYDGGVRPSENLREERSAECNRDDENQDKTHLSPELRVVR